MSDFRIDSIRNIRIVATTTVWIEIIWKTSNFLARVRKTIQLNRKETLDLVIKFSLVLILDTFTYLKFSG